MSNSHFHEAGDVASQHSRSAAREAVVRQDLGKISAPRSFSTKRCKLTDCLTDGMGSTVVDADGTVYLDGEAGL